MIAGLAALLVLLGIGAWLLLRPSAEEQFAGADPFGMKACRLTATWLRGEADVDKITVSVAVGDYAVKANTRALRLATSTADTSALIGNPQMNFADLKMVWQICRDHGVSMPIWSDHA
jgi:hypothetical protein